MLLFHIAVDQLKTLIVAVAEQLDPAHFELVGQNQLPSQSSFDRRCGLGQPIPATDTKFDQMIFYKERDLVSLACLYAWVWRSHCRMKVPLSSFSSVGRHTAASMLPGRKVSGHCQ